MTRAGRALTASLPALLAALGLAEALAVYVWNPGVRILLFQAAYALASAAAIVQLARVRPGDGAGRTVPAWAGVAVLALSFVVTLLLAQLALAGFANSGDEYGYNFVADTFRQGRLWNRAYPAPLRDVLATYYVGGHGDQRLSQYAPGWPVVLLAFKLVGAPILANAVVGLAAGLFLALALRRLALPRGVRFAALLLGVAAPFTLFNDASFFSHPLTAAALLAIVWLDLRDGERPRVWNRVWIGAAFSVLLTTRYEAFLLCFVPFAADGLWRWRWGFAARALQAAAGAAPATLLLLAYNWQVTGSPLTTTLAWVSPEIGFGLGATGGDGQHSAERGLLHTVFWLASWQDFASVLLLPLYGVALWRRFATRTVRWFDLLFPVVVAFFFFFPDNGGFQYGPRYWYVAHAAMPLTVAAGLPWAEGAWRIGWFRLDPVRLAMAQLVGFAGFTFGYAVFAHLQVENRMTPLHLADAAPPPAMVLMPTYGHRYVAWQGYPYVMLAKDYTRNGVGALPPVAIAVDLGEARTALLCTQVPDRAVYRIELDRIGPHGRLAPVCNGAR